MRFLKYAMLTLLVAIIADASLVFAYDSPTIQATNPQLQRNNPYYTSYVTKTTWTKQKYSNQDTYTALTNPCPKCIIETILYTDSGDKSMSFLNNAGDVFYFNDAESWTLPNNYRLYLRRYDITALTTYHWGLWYVNSNS